MYSSEYSSTTKFSIDTESAAARVGVLQLADSDLCVLSIVPVLYQVLGLPHRRRCCCCARLSTLAHVSQRTTTQSIILCEVGSAASLASHGLLPRLPTQRAGHTASPGHDSLQCTAASRELATVFAHGFSRDPSPQRSACRRVGLRHFSLRAAVSRRALEHRVRGY